MGSQAAKKALDKFRPQSGLKPTNQLLIGLLELVLTKNNFNYVDDGHKEACLHIGMSF